MPVIIISVTNTCVTMPTLQHSQLFCIGSVHIMMYYYTASTAEIAFSVSQVLH